MIIEKIGRANHEPRRGDINLHSNQINTFRHILFQIFAGIPNTRI